MLVRNALHFTSVFSWRGAGGQEEERDMCFCLFSLFHTEMNWNSLRNILCCVGQAAPHGYLFEGGRVLRKIELFVKMVKILKDGNVGAMQSV